MSTLANALIRKVAEGPVSWREVLEGLQIQGLPEGKYKATLNTPLGTGDWKEHFFKTDLGVRGTVKDGKLTEVDGEAGVTPTGLGYGASVVGGGALGAGIGHLVSDNKVVGALTGGAVGAVAAPVALLLASKNMKSKMADLA